MVDRGPAGGNGLLPILAGAAVGLVTGLLGMVLLPAHSAVPFSNGMVGAVGGGVTAALLSNRGLGADVTSAVLADVVSSVAFFVLALVFYLAFVWHTEGLHPLVAVWITVYYLVFGGLVALVIGLISAVIAAVSGAAASVAGRRFRA